jgi:peptide/nickel transport system substrate-binding protein
MSRLRGKPSAGGAPVRSATALVFLAAFAACSSQARPTTPADNVLRVGIGGLPTQSPERGIQQFISNISQEGLLRVEPDGTLKPWLAESWSTSPDGLQVTIRLRTGVTFHDGSPVDGRLVAGVLRDGLPKAMRTAYDDVQSIDAVDDRDIVVRFRQPSNYFAESLVDVPIQKPGNPSIGTGPFSASAIVPGQGAAEMSANTHYYLGPPTISRIALNTYANTRAAWADMLREQLDMLYEVDPDAMNTMKDSKSVHLYTFDRPYQYVVMLNARSPKLQDAALRRALNQAIDRPTLIREGLQGHGRPSVGPVAEDHFAFQKTLPKYTVDPRAVAAVIAKAKKADSKPLTLKCLMLPGAQYERLSLSVKRQLEAVGVSLEIEEARPEQIIAAVMKHEFETVLIDALSGPTMFRPYRWWIQTADFSHRDVVAAFDQVRHATGMDQYRTAVGEVQRAMAEDPPAIFLAWGTRSRAISTKFDVKPEQDRDIIATLRLWRQTADNRKATRN